MLWLAANNLGGGLEKAKTVIVVAVVGRVPVAVRRPNPVRFVVPRAAAQHTLASPVTRSPDKYYLIEKGFA